MHQQMRLDGSRSAGEKAGEKEGDGESRRARALTSRPCVTATQQALRFAFKCHQFAGGFDPEATQLFVTLSTSLQTAQEATDADES